MKEYKLSEILTIKNGRDYKNLKNGLYPVYGSGGLMCTVDNYLYERPSVLLPRKGTLSNIQFADSPFWTVDTLYYTEIDSHLADPYYLYYYLKQLDLTQLNSGTGVPSMTFDSYYNIKVNLPNIHEQRAVGQLLSVVDDKIQLNKRINDNLEAMAKQLYDYWFVQFDFPNDEDKPYKSSGGAMVWNEKLKRMIPQGWHCGTLLDIAEYTNGLACQKYRPIDNKKLPVIKIKEMHDGLSADTEWVKADIPDEVKVFDGDVLFSWSASLEVMLWAYGNGGLNQHIFKVTSKNGYPRSFYFYQLIHYVGVFKQMAEARKTTMGHITQDHLRQSTIALPPNVDIANKLEKKLCPIFDAIVKNSQEIMALTKQRDELIPLLMNGQASINSD